MILKLVCLITIPAIIVGLFWYFYEDLLLTLDLIDMIDGEINEWIKRKFRRKL